MREIGRGGMGVVYEAVHVQLGQRAAVKTLSAELSRGEEFRARFFTEARAAARVQHPGLVKVFDFGQIPDGSLYLLMEYLEGQPLHAARASEGGLSRSLPRSLEIGRQIAVTLSVLHAAGIVHRDLKPGNAMLVPDPMLPTGQRVILLDFGLAKVQGDPSASAPSQQTTEGRIMGTPVYMSPEQCRGDRPSGKSDLYSLGVMLYEMIAGAPPFPGANPAVVIAQHLLTQPVPLQRACPEVPAAVAALVDALLDKDPARRPDARETAERLVALANEPAPAERKRPRTARLWGAVAAALLCGGLGMAWLLRPSSRPAPGPPMTEEARSPTGEPSLKAVAGPVPAPAPPAPQPSGPAEAASAVSAAGPEPARAPSRPLPVRRPPRGEAPQKPKPRAEGDSFTDKKVRIDDFR